MKPQRNRARDIGFYVLILVLLACTLFTLLNQQPENELSYAQVKDFFKDEKVQEFTYNGSKNLLEMKVKDSSAKDGYKTVYYKMYSFSLFYEEFGDLIDEQYDKGIIKDYQIEPVQSTWWLQLIPYVLFSAAKRKTERRLTTLQAPMRKRQSFRSLSNSSRIRNRLPRWAQEYPRAFCL